MRYIVFHGVSTLELGVDACAKERILSDLFKLRCMNGKLELKIGGTGLEFLGNVVMYLVCLQPAVLQTRPCR